MRDRALPLPKSERVQTRLPDMDDETLLPALEEKQVDIKVLPSDGQASLLIFVHN